MENLHSKFSENADALDTKWQEFFDSLNDQNNDIQKNSYNPSWKRPDWPPINTEDFYNNSNFDQKVDQQYEEKIKSKAHAQSINIQDDGLKQAVLDSVRALMLIRAYRIRGHLAANLDPLNILKNNAFYNDSFESIKKINLVDRHIVNSMVKRYFDA